MNKSWKIILPITLAVIAASLGLFQHFSHPNKPLIKQTSNADSLADYFNAAKQLEPEQPATTTVTFLAAGDIMLSRNVALAIKNSNDVNLPFEKMEGQLNSTDFNFANLETPIDDYTHCDPNQKCPIGGTLGGHSLIFNTPYSYISGLTQYNFKILNLANNHAFDQGLHGLQNTRDTLDHLGIVHEGTGDNLDQAWEPAIVESQGIKICFIGASYSSINDGGRATNDYVARIEDTDRLKTAITKAKSKCNFVVATMHAGTEYTRNPNKSQIAFAHSAIDDGADIVIGAHPHWIQTTEKYQGKYIFYSLGNFIFDQNFSEDTMEGLTLKIQISKTQESNKMMPGAATSEDLQGQRKPAVLDSIELIPVIIQNSQPRPANETETKKILQKIGETENVFK